MNYLAALLRGSSLLILAKKSGKFVKNLERGSLGG